MKIIIYCLFKQNTNCLWLWLCFVLFIVQSNKRPRYEYSRSIELENQPPRSSISSQASPFFYHPHENNRRSSTWANLPIQNDGPIFLQDLSLPLSRTTTTTATPSNSFPEHDSLSLRYSSLIDEDHRSLRHTSSIFTTNPMQASIHKSLLISSMN